MNQRVSRSVAIRIFGVFLVALATHSSSAQKPESISKEEIDRRVIAALSHQGVAKAKVLAHIDLTGPFATASQWTFLAIQDGQPTNDFEHHGPISLCLVKAASPDCALHLYQQVRSEMPWFDTPYHLFSDSVVYAKQNSATPLLFLKVCGAQSFDGDCGIATALYTYDKAQDRFRRVFLNLTGRNNNQATRFVESGPLQGDVIIDNPTEKAPYNYWIEVYRAGDSGQYSRILRYRGHTGYADGNPLPVADSEMPEILRRFGFWKPGDPLPVPPRLPHGCKSLFLRKGEEWCK